MSLNKPKYNFFKNTKYAIDGLIEITKNEVSFKLQLLFFISLSIVSFLIPFKLHFKLILFFSLFLPIVAEIINSAIERIVDLITLEHNELAKKAKDIGAALVFISLLFTVLIWLSVFYIAI